jgi:hypothetical protein
VYAAGESCLRKLTGKSAHKLRRPASSSARPHVLRCDPTGTTSCELPIAPIYGRQSEQFNVQRRSRSSHSGRMGIQSLAFVSPLSASPLTLRCAPPSLLRMRLRLFLAFSICASKLREWLTRFLPPDMQDVGIIWGRGEAIAVVLPFGCMSMTTRVAEKCITNLSAKEEG